MIRSLSQSCAYDFTVTNVPPISGKATWRTYPRLKPTSTETRRLARPRRTPAASLPANLDMMINTP